MFAVFASSKFNSFESDTIYTTMHQLRKRVYELGTILVFNRF